ncbi:hypothetical protein B0T26DRAFT_681029 [Lasiosphaeria miniovina]|uniref:Uncharacterized protein n=1 Tax=Lasiosphaeria miniovina TaxID=1954250 RepID=A0AA39ZTP6_9PEZI|nr:uncharacterized protein B0T26DRAFT_681029 [Lasiosphaeria miniovina]KAK0703344.1 hypothetical protein B0T26DRAFT_681029 [Lasiosphaeria miniovina]
MATATRATLATVATIATANRATHYRHYHPGYARMTRVPAFSYNQPQHSVEPVLPYRQTTLTVEWFVIVLLGLPVEREVLLDLRLEHGVFFDLCGICRFNHLKE